MGEKSSTLFTSVANLQQSGDVRHHRALGGLTHVANALGFFFGNPRDLFRFLGRSVRQVQENFGIRVTDWSKHFHFLFTVKHLLTCNYNTECIKSKEHNSSKHKYHCHRGKKMLEKLKQNISEITAVATLSFALIGGAIAVESRYARIEDVEKIKDIATNDLTKMRIEQNIGLDNLRKQTVEDKLFDIRMKEKKSQTDLAMLQRYEEQLADVNSRIAIHEQKPK